MKKFTEEHTLTKDNIEISMNYYQNGFDNVVIIAPGWLMTKDSKSFLKISRIFTKDFDVITFDFRGHGNSKGFYTFSSKEIFDLDAVIKFAKSKHYKKICLVGFSLGGAVVLIGAAKHKRIYKVIAVSAPADFNKIEKKMWKKSAWGETIKKFELKRFTSLRMNLRLSLKKIKPINIVDKIKAPTLFVAGENDPIVYPWHTKKLYDNAVCEKEFKLFKRGFHAEDLYLYFKKEFSELCLNWLKKD